MWGLSLGRRAERRVVIGGECEGVADDPVVPAHDADDEVEEVPRVAAGDDGRHPCGDGCEDDADVEDEQDEVVRDGEEPLGQRHPPVRSARTSGYGTSTWTDWSSSVDG